MQWKSRHSAFTRVELVVVIIITGILMALLLPACHDNTRGSYRASCLNNMKQIGLAIQNYHDSAKTYPIGAAGNQGVTKMGPSWWLAILPNIEESTISARWDYGQKNEWATQDEAFPATTFEENFQLISGFAPDYMLCPSSTLPKVVNVTNSGAAGLVGDICQPSYVGIMGADDTTMALQNKPFINLSPSTAATGARISLDGTYGMTSSGGVLLVNDSVSIGDCTDGTSNTMVVSEISDFFDLTNSSGITTKVRRCAGYQAGTWLAGTSANSATDRSISVLDVINAPQVTGDDLIYNLNVVRYQPGQKKFIAGGFFLPGKGISGQGYQGADSSNGPNLNTPFVSPHSGGFSCVFLDSSTHFLQYDIDFQTLLRLATRHDGIPLGNDF